MTPERIEPVRKGAEAALRAWASALVGHRLVGVRYRGASGSKGTYSNSPANGAHEVGMDVVLDLDDGGSAVVSWAMDGLVEGLGLRIEPSADVEVSADDADVTTAGEWQQLVGQRIDAVAVAWHVPNEECPETLWATRLVLTGGESVTIALGEIENDVLEYQPDALLVLFGDVAALAYQPPASDSAFGNLLL